MIFQRSDQAVVRIDAFTGELTELEAPPSSVSRLVVSRTGRWVAGTHSSGPIHLWDMHSGRHREIPTRSETTVGAVAFAEDEDKFAVGFGNAVWVCKLPVGDRCRELLPSDEDEPSQLLADFGPVSALAFGKGDSLLAVGRTQSAFESNEVVIVEAQSGDTVRELGPFKGGVSVVRFSPDEERLAVGTFNLTDASMLRVFSVPEFSLLLTLDDAMDGEIVLDIEFSPDGSTLATSHWDSIRVWPSKFP